MSVLLVGSACVLLGGAWRVASHHFRGPEALVATAILAIFCLLGIMRVLGGLGLLTPVGLLASPFLLGLLMMHVARVPRPAWNRLRPTPLLFGAGALSAAILVGLLVQAWLYRSTAWDALWYHSLMTHSYVVNGSTGWLSVGVDYAAGYPNAVELLTAWPCGVLRTTTFDDVGQLPFGVIGAALVAAWARRAGARSDASFVVAVAWFGAPAVLLQMTSNLNDVAEAVSLASTLWFLLVGPSTAARSWWVLMSASLAFAAKGSGVVLLAPLAPFLTWNQLRASRSSRWWWLEILLRAGLVLLVGLYKPIENWFHTGNPFWPLANERLGLEGPVDPASFTWNGMHGLDCFFFTGEGDFLRMLASWYDQLPGYEPNMTSGGFGPVHAFLGVPAVIAAALLVWWQRSAAAHRWPLIAALCLFALGLMGPNPWWPRHILESSVASMVVLGAMLSRLPERAERALATLTLLMTAIVAVVAARAGIESYREHGLFGPLALSPAARSALASGPLWPAEVIEPRNATFEPEDGLAYERAVWLPTQFVPWNYGSRVLWVEPEGAPAEYLARLREEQVRWVVLRTPRWRAALVALGATEIHRHNDEVILEIPARDPPDPE